MNLKQQLAVRLADSPLWQRWQRLAPRERTSLSLLGAFLLAVLFYLWLWLPAQRQAAEARDYYQAQRSCTPTWSRTPNWRGRWSAAIRSNWRPSSCRA